MKQYVTYLILLFLFVNCFDSNQKYNPEIAEKFFQYSRIAYCQSREIQEWGCPNCQAIDGVKSVFVAIDKHYKSQAYVTYDVIEELIVIAIRGTDNFRNWLSNLHTTTTHYAYCEKCKVHYGFYNYWKSISSRIIEQVQILKDKYPNYELLVTGHSLGGAVANFAALEIKEYLNIQADHVITFGQPRVGNKHFQQYFNNMIPNLQRVTHLRDPVPHVPTMMQGFRHAFQEIYYNNRHNESIYKICSDKNGEDDNCIDDIFGSRINDHLRYYSQYTGCEDEVQVYSDDFENQNPFGEDFSDLDEQFTRIIFEDHVYRIKNQLDN